MAPIRQSRLDLTHFECKRPEDARVCKKVKSRPDESRSSTACEGGREGEAPAAPSLVRSGTGAPWERIAAPSRPPSPASILVKVEDKLTDLWGN